MSRFITVTVRLRKEIVEKIDKVRCNLQNGIPRTVWLRTAILRYLDGEPSLVPVVDENNASCSTQESKLPEMVINQGSNTDRPSLLNSQK